MDQAYITAALIGCPTAGTHHIFRALGGRRRRRKDDSFRSRVYSYSGQDFMAVELPQLSSFTTFSPRPSQIREFLCSGRTDVIILVCEGSYLEPGLTLLKELIGLDEIKEKGVPVILCVNHCFKAIRRGIQIDLELLEDVLEIPVLCCSALEKGTIDDLKAAVHFEALIRRRRLFHYECLDFSPCRLANECILYTWEASGPILTAMQYASSKPVTWLLVALLMLLTILWLAASDALLPPGVFLIQKLLKLLGGLGAGGLKALSCTTAKLLDTCLVFLYLRV